VSQALATANQTAQRENYCILLISWKSPDEVNDQELLRKIMNLFFSENKVIKLLNL
jgi:hypothetical protein